MKDINLAYKLEDGMKIHVSTKQEKANQNHIDENDITDSLGISVGNEKKENTQNAKVNINTATQTQLETLPGIGPSTAIKILNYRKEKGRFKKIEDIKEVSGVGDNKFEKMKAFITI